MKPRKTIHTVISEKSQSRTANIDNCNYIIRHEGHTIYCYSEHNANVWARKGATVFRRLSIFDD